MEKAAVGILMLETNFPRPPGDIGNGSTWDFPVQMRKVGGASAQKVVQEDPRALLDAFVQVGREMIADGCSGLTTSCGFLSLMQEELKDALGVPFASSSLMQIPTIEAMLPSSQDVGVLTISKESLWAEHLQAAGARGDIAIEGLPRDGSFATAIFDDLPDMDFAACQAEMNTIAQRLVTQHRSVGAIVLECANMAPYAAQVARISRRPVYSVVSFLNWFQAGMNPLHY